MRLAVDPGGLTADPSPADIHQFTVGAGLARDGGLTADQSLAGVHIHFCGNGRLGFRLTATHFFYKRLKKVSKKTLG
ncbi:hypothetical protein KRR23_22330, partial [Pseudomonas sp. CVAP|uniref:hypothetical protein n=1 Tax=Pseudomonas sp. CVAP\